jgi:hypothetical protein
VAFVLDFGEDGPNLRVGQVNMQSIVTTAVGFDPDVGTSYTLSVSLELMAIFAGFELSFWLSAEHEAGGQEDYWRGTTTKFISGLYRSLIVDVLCLSVGALIRTVLPDRVTMMAIDPYLPDKAIGKYLRINDIFISEGYSVAETPEKYGIRAWIMERQELS